MTKWTCKSISATVYEIKRGREKVGYAQQYATEWRASVVVNGVVAKATASTATAACQSVLQAFVDLRAQKHGFKNHNDELVQHNKAVVQKSIELNQQALAAGLPPIYRVRTTKISKH